MKKNLFGMVACIAVCCSSLLGEENNQPATAPEATPAQLEHFETYVRPLLLKNCIGCHGPKKQHAELRLDSRQAILKGGESGPAIVPFKPEESLLIESIRRESFEMPPEEELPKDEIAILTEWVKQGAVWPKSAADENSAGPDFDSHWSFQPITNPEPPQVKNQSWARNAIDHFVLRKLEQNGLPPAPPADKATLLRRMKWDLVGLPLTKAELDAVGGVEATQAIKSFREDLLASPHYGERWGRYWLDLARYADTKGYVFFEKPTFHNGFTYRDYVIQSFNEDKPYNQFVMEQLAADQLEGAPYEALAALGFITIGPHLKNETHDIMADRIDVVTRGFLGLTVGCARCHDHKYDPISQEDYYSFYGIFRNSLEPLHLPFKAGDQIPEGFQKQAAEIKKAAKDLEQHYLTQYQKVMKQSRERLGEYLAGAQSQRSGPDTTLFDVIVDGDDLSPQLLLIWQQYLEDQDKQKSPVWVPWNELAKLPADQFEKAAPQLLGKLKANQTEEVANSIVVSRLQQKSLTRFEDVVEVYTGLFNEVDEEWQKLIAKEEGATAKQLGESEREEIRQVMYAAESPLQMPYHAFRLLRLFPDRKSQKKVNELNAAIDAIRAKAPQELAQFLVVEDAETILEPRVFKRGNPSRPAEYVARQYLRYFNNVSDQPFVKGSGRLELAEAIVSPNNTLTARVIVNRVWQHHFGQGLVRTPSDFGMQSEPPTHPELLDHLASWFVQHNWSLKELHRYIMSSATYQQASLSHPQGEQLDPGNKLCWKMNRRRLDLETMRDALLAVTGKLDLTVGGKSVKGAMSENNNRRTLYTHVDRQNLPSVMRAFDFPPPDVSTGARNNTTVPGQALFLMNHPLVHSSSLLLANRAEAMTDQTEGIRYLFETILHREPSEQEIDEFQHFLSAEQQGVEPQKITPSAWQYGYAKLDEAKQEISNFQPLPYWAGEQAQGGSALPDRKIGWVYLNAEGGHPGNDLNHVAVMRWTAPEAMMVSLKGEFKHIKKQGDGVRGRVLKSNKPLSGPWVIHNKSVRTEVTEIAVEAGETIDFVVDILKVLSHDDFLWAPEISELSKNLVAVEGANLPVVKKNNAKNRTWNYTKDFRVPEEYQPVTPWQSVTQVLILSNEFQFVD